MHENFRREIEESYLAELERFRHHDRFYKSALENEKAFREDERRKVQAAMEASERTRRSREVRRRADIRRAYSLQQMGELEAELSELPPEAETN
jgi:hypothetical protein